MTVYTVYHLSRHNWNGLCKYRADIFSVNAHISITILQQPNDIDYTGFANNTSHKAAALFFSAHCRLFPHELIKPVGFGAPNNSQGYTAYVLTSQ